MLFGGTARLSIFQCMWIINYARFSTVRAAFITSQRVVSFSPQTLSLERGKKGANYTTNDTKAISTNFSICKLKNPKEKRDQSDGCFPDDNVDLISWARYRKGLVLTVSTLRETRLRCGNAVSAIRQLKMLLDIVFFCVFISNVNWILRLNS